MCPLLQPLKSRALKVDGRSSPVAFLFSCVVLQPISSYYHLANTTTEITLLGTYSTERQDLEENSPFRPRSSGQKTRVHNR